MGVGVGLKERVNGYRVGGVLELEVCEGGGEVG